MPRAAIIGAGRVGSTLGSRLLAAGWEVRYGSRDPLHSRMLKDTLQAQPAASGSSVAEAVAWAASDSGVGSAVVLAVPGRVLATQQACAHLAHSLGHHAAGQVIIDATNPLDAAGNELVWERRRSSAEVLQEAMPGSYVYKAFNTVGVEHMAHPDGSLVTGQRLTLMFAGPAERQADVMALIAAVGFLPEWVGGLRYARNLEATAELYMHLGAGLGEAVCWGQPDGTRRFHFQVLRHDQQPAGG